MTTPTTTTMDATSLPTAKTLKAQIHLRLLHHHALSHFRHTLHALLHRYKIAPTLFPKPSNPTTYPFLFPPLSRQDLRDLAGFRHVWSIVIRKLDTARFLHRDDVPNRGKRIKKFKQRGVEKYRMVPLVKKGQKSQLRGFTTPRKTKFRAAPRRVRLGRNAKKLKPPKKAYHFVKRSTYKVGEIRNADGERVFKSEYPWTLKDEGKRERRVFSAMKMFLCPKDAKGHRSMRGELLYEERNAWLCSQLPFYPDDPRGKLEIHTRPVAAPGTPAQPSETGDLREMRIVRRALQINGPMRLARAREQMEKGPLAKSLYPPNAPVEDAKTAKEQKEPSPVCTDDEVEPFPLYVEPCAPYYVSEG